MFWLQLTLGLFAILLLLFGGVYLFYIVMIGNRK